MPEEMRFTFFLPQREEYVLNLSLAFSLLYQLSDLTLKLILNWVYLKIILLRLTSDKDAFPLLNCNAFIVIVDTCTVSKICSCLGFSIELSIHYQPL